MATQPKRYIYLATLITHARLKQGHATLKELYRLKKPLIDYQTWLHAESGRRVPTPTTVIEIGDILSIDREDLIIAYCQDKFCDQESLRVIESFRYKKFVNPDTMMEAREHDLLEDYVLTAKQVKAMQADVRLRLYLIYTYDQEYKTTFARLSEFFKVDVEEVKQTIAELEKLNLVEVHHHEIKRIHRHTTMPKSIDVFDLRRQILLKSLELNIKQDSYIANCHAMITEESYKKYISYLDFAEANFLKLNRDDETNANRNHVQLAIIVNKITKRKTDG